MKIEDFVLNEWNYVSNSQFAPEVFIEILKKRIDEKGDFEFSDDYTKFKRIVSFVEFSKDLPDGKSYRVEYDLSRSNHQWEYDLPILIKTYSQKDWDRKTGRNK